jgi:hypothetical protein
MHQADLKSETTELQPYVEKTMAFLNEIGLPIAVVPGASAFLELIRIVEGRLEIDPLCPVSNILHEAGHLATVPSAFRHLMTGNLDEGIKRMFDEIEKMGLHPDHPLSRSAMQASEVEATAWAWAVGEHLDIPPDVAILDSEYDNDGAEVRSMLMARAYYGIHGLMHAGFCVNRANPNRNLPVYPKLAYWLQQ